MRLHEQHNDVSTAGLGEQHEMNIADGAQAKIIDMIMSNNYNDPMAAMVREYGQNHSDKRLGKGGVFRLHMPTMLEPHFSVIDDGIGLSLPDIFNLLGSVGGTTKDKANYEHPDGTIVTDEEYLLASDDERELFNEVVGGFGLGAKVAFAVVDQFTIISRFNGVMYTVSAYRDDRNKPQYVLLDEHSTDEVNGLEIRVPIEDRDFYKVERAVRSQLRYFNPKPTANTELEWDAIEYWMTGKDGTWGMSTDTNDTYRYTQSRVIMGNLWYPIETSKIREQHNDSHSTLLDKGIDIHLPIGSVSLPLSREAIIYDNATLSLIRGKLDAVADEILQESQVNVDKAPNVWSAMSIWTESGNLIYRLTKSSRSGVKGLELKYKGQKLSNRMQWSCPFNSLAVLPKYMFSRKTLNIAGSEQYVTRGNISLNYTSTESLVFVVSGKCVRKPSRLLAYMKDVTRNTKEAWVVTCDEGKEDTTISWLNKNLGFKDNVFIFDDVIPDITVVRTPSQRKSVCKVKTWKDTRNYHWDDDYWSSSDTEVDLATNTGIYVDLRRGEPHECKSAYTNQRIESLFKSLKSNGFIPEGTILYGCPGSVKNKMTDHANFMSLDEAVAAAYEIGDTTLNDKNIREFTYQNSLKRFTATYKDIFSLDISVKKSYYNTIETRVKRFVNEVEVKDDNYKTYEGVKTLDSLLRKETLHQDREDLLETVIQEKFFKKYPLLAFVGRGYGESEGIVSRSIEEYVTLKGN